VLLNVPFGLLTVPLALRWLPATARRAGTRPALDLVGLAPELAAGQQALPRGVSHGLLTCVCMLALSTVVAALDLAGDARTAARIAQGCSLSRFPRPPTADPCSQR
jgi:hypothetical protein